MSQVPPNLKVLLTSDQVSRRVTELARQISSQHQGKTLYVICLLDNGFMFMADLVRQMDIPVVCMFMKPVARELSTGLTPTGPTPVKEIFYTPKADVRGQDVLLVEGIMQSGVTQEFLVRNLQSWGAASVKIATFLDKQVDRRVPIQPDYFGYLIDESFVVGYGLGDPLLGRNLRYVAATSGAPRATASGT